MRQVDRDFLVSEGIEKDYPYVSLCGKEVNLIRPAALPLVFHSLVGDELHFGGNLTVAFQPSSLAVSERTGRLYHKIEKNTRTTQPGISYGLIRSSVAVALSEHIQPGDQGKNIGKIFFCNKGKFSMIDNLPLSSEPGEWALPDAGDE